ncbi:MAG: nucleotidyltransferase domain-containing protein [Pseudonocardia sp.]|nr:nucleotidyltransferase domain-containing protein [Pseudonocardia sp.]
MTVGTGTELGERVRDVLNRRAVLAAYLFGSRAKGRSRPTSDVDVAILVGGHRVDRAAVAADVGQAVTPLRSDLLVLDDAPAPWRSGCSPTVACCSAATRPRPDNPLLHVCLLTYGSELTLLGSVVTRHPIHSSAVQMASLDHAMWYHKPFRGASTPSPVGWS